VLEPLLPRLFGDVLEDALAERSRIWREIEAFGFFSELHTLDVTCHDGIP
jgi:hypothetical protein